MKPTVPFFAAALLASTALIPAAEAAGAIGAADEIVVRAYGTVPGQNTEPLYRNDPVYVDERIETPRMGGARIEFHDQTELWIGEESEVVLDEFIYDPNTNSGEFVAELGTGLFRFVTGEMESEGFTVNTPVATIGVRGTDFSVLVAASGAITAGCYSGSICIKPHSGEQVCINAGQTATVATASSAVSVSDTGLATAPAGVSAPDAGIGAAGGHSGDNGNNGGEGGNP